MILLVLLKTVHHTNPFSFPLRTAAARSTSQLTSNAGPGSGGVGPSPVEGGVGSAPPGPIKNGTAFGRLLGSDDCLRLRARPLPRTRLGFGGEPAMAAAASAGVGPTPAPSRAAAWAARLFLRSWLMGWPGRMWARAHCAGGKGEEEGEASKQGQRGGRAEVQRARPRDGLVPPGAGGASDAWSAGGGPGADKLQDRARQGRARGGQGPCQVGETSYLVTKLARAFGVPLANRFGRARLAEAVRERAAGPYAAGPSQS